MMANNTIKTVKRGFDRAYNQLKLEQVKSFRADCGKRLGWSEATINNKRCGRSEIFIPEKPILRAIFRKYDIELIEGINILFS